MIPLRHALSILQQPQGVLIVDEDNRDYVVSLVAYAMFRGWSVFADSLEDHYRCTAQQAFCFICKKPAVTANRFRFVCRPHNDIRHSDHGDGYQESFDSLSATND